jgi:hypothetical protein
MCGSQSEHTAKTPIISPQSANMWDPVPSCYTSPSANYSISTIYMAAAGGPVVAPPLPPTWNRFRHKTNAWLATHAPPSMRAIAHATFPRQPNSNSYNPKPTRRRHRWPVRRTYFAMEFDKKISLRGQIGVLGRRCGGRLPSPRPLHTTVTCHALL